MWLFIKFFLIIALAFFTCLNEQFHNFDKSNLLERLNKRTLFFSVGLNTGHFLESKRDAKQNQIFLSDESHIQSAEKWSQEKRATDLSGIGFLGDMDDDSKKKESHPPKIAAQKPSQAPKKADAPVPLNPPPFVKEKISQKKTPPKPIFDEADPTPDLLPERESGAGTTDVAATSTLPGIDPLSACGSSDQKATTDQDCAEGAAARTLSPLEACGNLQQTDALEGGNARECMQPRPNELSGILVMHFQTMIQISQLLLRGPVDMPCNSRKQPLRKNTLFFQAMGSYFNQDKCQNLLGFTSQIYGATLGIEHAFSSRWRGKGAIGLLLFKA